MKIKIPYGKEYLEAQISDERINGVITSSLDKFIPAVSESELVLDSMENPIGSERLDVLAKHAKTAVIIASDHTRPVPSKIIIPNMLMQLRKGNPNIDITILIATGCHRGTTKNELVSKFGEEIVTNEKIVIHDCDDTSNLVQLGVLPSGGKLTINRLAVEADLLVSEGFIEPHFFAGYSGGRKSVLPGIASRETVHANHCSEFIADEHARCGVLEGNPIHTDMVYAARKAKLQFIVNVVINSKHEVIGSFSGDCEKAHLAGADFLADLCKTPAIYSDIVITSNNGYPLDQNIYQTVKGMSTAESTCNPGGVIIIAAKCEDGCGGEAFYQTFKQADSAEQVMNKILQIPRSETVMDQWQSQIFARILMKFHVILVSQTDADIVRGLHMIPACTIEKAIEIADSIVNKPNCKITVIPEGISSMIY